METYKYSAVSKSGTKVTGIIEAFNEVDAATRVKQQYDIIMSLSLVEDKGNSIFDKEIGGNKINSKAFTLMCSQFAIILASGIPIARTCHLIANKATDKKLKKILTSVASDVEEGHSLSEAFQERGGDLLPPTFVETVYAGEQSGNLDHAFQSLYEHFDKQTKMRGKVKSALSYPIFVLIIAVIVVMVLMVKVVPTFTAIFDSYGQDLPFMTRLLVGISNFFRKYYIVMLAIMVLIYVGYRLYTSSEKGKMNFAMKQLEFPILGEIATLNAASQFANNLAILLASGLALNNALEITSRIFDNYYISSEVRTMAHKLEEGKSLGRCMQESGALPDILTDMVAVGEETGEMEQTLGTIAKYYDAELEMAIDSAMKKLEPALLVVLAGIAGFIVVAIYMCMFDMYGAM